MDLLTLLGTAVALGADAFAVSAAVAAGLPRVTARHTFRLTWHFGFFQFMMTALGWAGGESLFVFASGLNYWIGAGILFFLGFKMIYDSRDPEKRVRDHDPTRGWSLVSLSVATSLDALAIGISLSLIGISVWWPAIYIGLTALVMSFVGTRLGRRAGHLLGQWAERIGGMILIVIGARILVEYAAR